MERERIILKKLREQNKLTLDEAAKLIGKSKGWLSEIENNKGRSVLRPKDYGRIYALYNGDKYKRYFGSWVKKVINENKSQSTTLDGAIYKFLRCHKAKLSLDCASRNIGVSKGYLSKVENGQKQPNKKLKESILKAYEYSPSSWKNFATHGPREKSIPVKYKLNILLKNLKESEFLKVMEFILSL